MAKPAVPRESAYDRSDRAGIVGEEMSVPQVNYAGGSPERPEETLLGWGRLGARRRPRPRSARPRTLGTAYDQAEARPPPFRDELPLGPVEDREHMRGAHVFHTP